MDGKIWSSGTSRIFRVSSFQSLPRAIFSLVSKRIKNLFKTISEDSFTSEPRHQMCWTLSPLMLQSWVWEQDNFARISCAKGPKQSSACRRNLRSIVAQTMTSECVWKSNLTRGSLLKLTTLAKGSGLTPETPRTLTPEMSSV
jgi:hypothetical protein